MQAKLLVRLILLTLFLGLNVVMGAPSPYGWLAAWALVVLGSGTSMAMWKRGDWKLDPDGTVTFLCVWAFNVLGGLIIGLVEGAKWWSLAVAFASLLGYLVFLALALFADLQKPDNTAYEAYEAHV